VIPTLGRLRQEGSPAEDSLGYIARPGLKNMPVIPATQDVQGRRIEAQSQFGQKVSNTPPQPIKVSMVAVIEGMGRLR
jgi:hypothetical protein